MIKFKKIINCLQNPQFYKSYFNGISPLFELTPLLQKINKAETLIDIGSNKGQFGLIARKFFPNIKIHSFEPQIEQLNKQKKVLGNNNINFYNFALGNEKKSIELNVTLRKDSSSLLKPIENTNDKYSIENIIDVQVKKIDELIELKNLKKPIILKLDVQGYELEVLKGAEKMLNYINYIITEISFINIYQNQVLSDELIKFLESKSFLLTEKCNLSMLDDKPFQEDVLFIKK